MNISSTARFASAFAIISTLVAGLAAAPLLANAAPSTAAGCTRYIGVFAPGTTETRADADPSKPAGMLGQVGEKLETMYGPNTFRAIYPSYPAEAFLQSGMTYSASKTAGDQAMATAMEQCPNSKFVIGGYSQRAGRQRRRRQHRGGRQRPRSRCFGSRCGHARQSEARYRWFAGRRPQARRAGHRRSGSGRLRRLVGSGLRHLPPGRQVLQHQHRQGFVPGVVGTSACNPPGTVAPTTATAVSATTTPSVTGQTALTPTDTASKPASTPAAANPRIPRQAPEPRTRRSSWAR